MGNNNTADSRLNSVSDDRAEKLIDVRKRGSRTHRMLAVLSCMAVLITALALMMPAISMTRGELTCDLEEHQHTAACYEKVLVCDKEEGEDHQHTDACYKKKLKCDKVEHKHTDACYEQVKPGDESEDSADKEDGDSSKGAAKADGASSEAASAGSGNAEGDASPSASSPDAEGDAAKSGGASESEGSSSASAVGAVEAGSDSEKPAQSFEGDLKDADGNVELSVSVEAPEGAFPAGTFMEIGRVADEDVQDAVQEAVKKSEGDDVKVKSMTSVDIKFRDTDGNEIEPAKQVQVKITSADVRDFEDPMLVHVIDKSKKSSEGKTEDAEVVKKVSVVNQDENDTSTGSEDTMKFKADAFSPYVVVELEELTGQVITANGETYDISVTYGPDAKIPSGATLEAVEIAQDNEEWQKYYDQTAVEMGEKAGPAYARFFDIKIMVDGQEVEPAAPVETKITYREGINLLEGMAVKAVHFADDQVEIIDVDCALNEDGVAGEFVFKQDGFSVTGVVTTSIESGRQYVIYYHSSSSGNRYAMAHDLTTQQITANATNDNVGTEVTSTADDVLWTFEAVSGGYRIYYTSGNINYYLRATSNDGAIAATTNANDNHITWAYSNNNIKNIGRNRYLQRNEGSFRTSSNTQTLYLALYTPPTPVTLTVHYINESGDQIQNPTTVSSMAQSGVTAIKDVVIPITGYTYHNTYLKSKSGTQIVPEIRSDGNGAWSYQKFGQEEYTAFAEDTDIYVVYGDPYAASGSGGGGGGGGDDPDIGTPQTDKVVVSNEDGTYTLSLSITGKGKSASSSNGANVILILDTSNSMNGEVDGGGTRFSNAVEAAQNVSTNLLALNTEENPSLVEMCLVEFDWDTKTSGWYTDAGVADSGGTYPEGSFNWRIAEAERQSGTNWEAALRSAIAAAQEKNDGDDTYIIFLTDGNPSSNASMPAGTRYTAEAQTTDPNGTWSGNDANGTQWSNFPTYYRICQNYMRATDEARAIVQAGYYFYSIGMYGNVDVLAKLTNFAYNGRSDSVDSGHYYAAAQTSALIEALSGIAEVIKNSLSLAGVSFNDGIATDTTSTALSSTVSGTPGGITYSKIGGTTPGYTVRVDSGGTPTFTVGSTSVVGTIETIDYEKITDETTTVTAQATVYRATIGDDDVYNMPMATIEDGQLHWDLAPLGTLEDQATYKISFVVWPDQDAYDYVADLNNGLATWDTETQVEVTDDSGTLLYYKNGVEGLPNIVYYPDSGVYQALTNTNQTVNYYVANTEESGGTTTTTYTQGDPINMPNPDPMGLTASLSKLEKKWNADLQKTQLISYLYDTWTGESKKKTLDFKVKKDGEVYKTITLGWDDETNQYVWTDSTETITYYDNDYTIGTVWGDDFAIATGVMLSAENMQARGLDTSKYPSGTYNGKTYYVLETGHDYDIEEPSLGSYSFDFVTQTYHPMLVDGVLKNVVFTTSGTSITITDMTPDGELTSLRAENTLRGGINLDKVVVDESDQEINPDTTFTFTIRIHNDEENIFTGDNTPWYSINGNYYHDSDGNYITEAEAIVFYGNKEAADAQGGNVLTAESPYTDASTTIAVTSSDSVRIANVPLGTTYTIVETVASGYELQKIDKVIALSSSEQTTDTTGVDVSTATVTGEIVPNRENNITYTNKKTGSSVSLLKVDADNADTKLDGVSFDLYSDAAHANKVNTEPITTANGGRVDLGLLNNGTYYLVETAAHAGYNMLGGDVIIVVSASGVTYSQSDYGAGQYADAAYADGVYTITVRNSAGVVLPTTGGSGTWPFVLVGLALIALASAILFARRPSSAATQGR